MDFSHVWRLALAKTNVPPEMREKRAQVLRGFTPLFHFAIPRQNPPR
jgi:hypothetical protein